MATPFLPMAVAGSVVERLSYLTDIQVSEDGTEQRVALRSTPVESWAYEARTLGEQGRTWNTTAADAQLLAPLTTAWAVPRWPDATLLTAPAAAGSAVTLAVLSTQDRAFGVAPAGGLALLWADGRTAELVTVTAVTPTTLTVATLGGAWPAGSIVLPARLAVFDAAPEVHRVSAQAASWSVAFRLALGPEAVVTRPTAPEVFAVPYDRIRPADTRARPVDRLEFPTGSPYHRDFPTRTHPVGARREQSLWLPTKASTAELIEWFHRLRGRWTTFFLPTYLQDLVPLAGLGTTTLTVAACGYTATLFPNPARRTLALIQPGGVITKALVTAATENGDGTETLTLDVAAPAATSLVSFLLYGRLDSDTLELRWRGGDAGGGGAGAECTIGFQETPGELDALGGTPSFAAGTGYGTLEDSRQAGQPVELYQFTTGAGPGYETPPPAPGGLLPIDALDSAAWTTQIHFATEGPAGEAGKSATVWAAAPPRATIYGAWDGPLGEGGGYYYQRRTFGAAQGIVANHPYVVRVLLSRTTAVFGQHGARVAVGAGGAGLAFAADVPTYHDFSLTTDSAGTFTVELGHFDLEVGFSNIVTVHELWLYDLATAPGSGTPAGLPATLYRYTSADAPVSYGGALHLPTEIQRTAFSSGGADAARAEVELTLPRDHTVALLFRDGLPVVPVTCTVTRLHRADLTDAVVPAYRWQVARAEYTGPGCTLALASARALLSRRLPRILCQRDCPHVLGGPLCQADLAAKTHAGLTASAVTGRTVTVPGSAALAGADLGYFGEGVLRADGGGRAFIERYDAASETLVLKAPLAGLVAGAAVTLQAGCDRKPGTCQTRWANILHFGGEPTMPERNPFGVGGLSV